MHKEHAHAKHNFGHSSESTINNGAATNGNGNDQLTSRNFWQKVSHSAKSAGKKVIEMALVLYYVYQHPATPTWAKAAILGALGYFISPIDAIPDITPIIGYSDDAGILAVALAAVAPYVTQYIKDKARQKLMSWFH